ncbi:unnamed protein product [Brassica rapa subsp. trilocularis]
MELESNTAEVFLQNRLRVIGELWRLLRLLLLLSCKLVLQIQ